MSTKDSAVSDDVLAGSGARPDGQLRAVVPRRITSTRELLGGGTEVQIEHNGEIYTLRQTSKGKLILTK
ncbi:MAG TPA: hemin uptake protein HemP [Burkholderiales bacterium]